MNARDLAIAGVEPSAAADRGSSSVDAPLDRRWLWLLVASIVVGALVRLIGLDAKGVSHPEIYIPGLDLPPGISEPPPRRGFVETLAWHFRAEPHPVGYYMAMWAWTKLFGASIVSIRLPEAILGALSVLAAYRLGALAYGRRAGVLAALLLSLHGFHVFWSQVARMYVPGAFLALVSTWLLLEMSRAERPKLAAELGYVLCVVAGAFTVEFFWIVLGMHILWAALAERPSAKWQMSRAGYFQALAFMLSAPNLSHALMLARADAAPPPTLDFLMQYFSFGFLFEHGAYTEATWSLPVPLALVLLVAAAFLLVRGLRVPTREAAAHAALRPPSIWWLGLVALAMCVAMLAIAAIADARNDALAALAVVPALAFVIPVIVASVRPAIARVAPLEQLLRKHRNATALVPMLAVVPTLVLFALSFNVALTAPRAFVMFVPYLLIVVAAGVLSLRAWPIVGAALLIVFAASTVVLRAVPISPRDYRGLAEAMNARMEAGDVVFTPARDWAYTPMFLYLDHRRLVAANYAAALRRAPGSRVWVLSMLDQPPAAEMRSALAGYAVAGKVEALRANAVLYVPAR